MKTGRHESKITLNRQVSPAEGGRTFLFRPLAPGAAGARRLRSFTVRRAKCAGWVLCTRIQLVPKPGVLNTLSAAFVESPTFGMIRQSVRQSEATKCPK